VRVALDVECALHPLHLLLESCRLEAVAEDPVLMRMTQYVEAYQDSGELVEAKHRPKGADPAL